MVALIILHFCLFSVKCEFHHCNLGRIFARVFFSVPACLPGAGRLLARSRSAQSNIFGSEVLSPSQEVCMLKVQRVTNIQVLSHKTPIIIWVLAKHSRGAKPWWGFLVAMTKFKKQVWAFNINHRPGRGSCGWNLEKSPSNLGSHLRSN